MNEDDPLAKVNLQVWQPPAPRAVDPAALLSRMVAPAAPRARQPWLVVSLVVANIALVASLLVVVMRKEPPQIVTLPAGGPDISVREQLRRLEQQRQDLVKQLADIDQLNATITQLSTRVRECEQKPAPTPAKPKVQNDIATSLTEPTLEDDTYTSPPSTSESLDRDQIKSTVDKIRPAIKTCGASLEEGRPLRIRVHVRVTPGGLPSSTVEDTTETVLATCVVRAMNKARFPRTRTGGTFSYPFMFGMQLE